MRNSADKTIQAIIEKAYKGVISITGGASGAITELLKHGGASAVLLYAVVPYAPEALADFIGSKPEKAVSELTARQMAVSAYHKAREFSDEPGVFGLGATCVLQKAGTERAGREHKICVAYQTELKTAVYSIELPHISRVEEEDIASEIIIQVIADAVGVPRTLADPYGRLLTPTDTAEPCSEIVELFHGTRSAYAPNGPISTHTFYPGSFNPLHDGHLEVAQIGSEVTGEEVCFELSITNVDKPPLDYIEILKRISQFKDKRLILTDSPTFLDKVSFSPNSTFLVGYDTWSRLLDSNYYDSKATLVSSLHNMHDRGTKFIVFAREIDGIVKRLDTNYHNYDMAVPAPRDPIHMNCSSTKLRAEASKS